MQFQTDFIQPYLRWLLLLNIGIVLAIGSLFVLQFIAPPFAFTQQGDYPIEPLANTQVWSKLNTQPVASTKAKKEYSFPSLGVKVNSIIANETGTFGTAFFTGSFGDVVLSPGDILTNGIRLVALFPQHAIFLESDRNFDVFLSESKTEGSPMQPQIQQATAQPPKDENAFEQLLPNHLKLDPNIKRVIGELNTNPAIWSNLLSFMPVTVDKQAGFQITIRSENEFFTKIGLRDNDIILKINGQAVTNFITSANKSTIREILISRDKALETLKF